MHFWGTWIFLFYITSAHAEGLPIVAESRVGSYRCADFSDQVRCNAKDGCHWRSEFWPPTCHEYKDKSAEHPTAQSENECVGLVIEECSNLDRCTWQEEYWPHGCERKAAYEARTRNSDGTLQRGDEGADQQDDAKIVSRNLNGFAQHHDAGQNDDMEIVPRNRDDVVRHDGNGYENHGHRRVAQDDDIDVVSRDRVKAVHHDIEAPDYNGLFQQIFLCESKVRDIGRMLSMKLRFQLDKSFLQAKLRTVFIQMPFSYYFWYFSLSHGQAENQLILSMMPGLPC